MMTLTDRALEMVRSYLDQSGGELTALRIAVSGGTPSAPEFELTLVGSDEIRGDEIELDVSGLTIVVNEGTAPRLEDATVDFVERVNESGFEVRLAAGPTTPRHHAHRRLGAEGPRDPRGPDQPRHRLTRRRHHPGRRPRHRDLPGDGRRLPGMRHVTHDAPSGRGAHGAPGGSGDHGHPRRDGPRVRREPVLRGRGLVAGSRVILHSWWTGVRRRDLSRTPLRYHRFAADGSGRGHGASLPQHSDGGSPYSPFRAGWGGRVLGWVVRVNRGRTYGHDTTIRILLPEAPAVIGICEKASTYLAWRQNLRNGVPATMRSVK